MKFKSRGEAVFSVVNNIFMALLMLIFIIPFWMVFTTSFVSEAESAARGSFILWPQTFDISAYKILLFNGSQIYRAYMNTIFVVVVGTFVNLLLTVTMAYSLSKRDLPARNGITVLVFITMLFSGGLVPSFLLNKYLGLIDSRWSLILPGAVSAWNMFITRNFFMELPQGLEDAALIDGAGPMRVLFTIVLPISVPVLATIGLFYAVGHWNAWFSAAIYINTPAKLPIQNILREILFVSAGGDLSGDAGGLIDKKPPAETIRSAMIMISTLPIMCVYPFIQKYFVKGVMIGSIKG